MSEGHAWRSADTHSPDVLEVLGEPPPWLVRWGMSLTFLGVAVLLAASWVIRYPEVVTAPVMITTVPPPAELAAAAAGVLRLAADDGTAVEAGQRLAVIEPPGVRVADVDALRASVEAYRTALDDTDVPPPAHVPFIGPAVGELHAPALALAALDSEMRAGTPERRLVHDWRWSLAELETRLASWTSRHVLTAPSAGRFVLVGEAQDGRRVDPGEVVAVLLSAAERVTAIAQLTDFGVGRVEGGQRALIRLASHPPADFGVVEARVGTISPVAHEGRHRLEVTLPDGLRTSFGYALDVSPGMRGEVEILTDDTRIWDRLFQFILPRKVPL